jgi:hypothetical protein
VEKGEQMNWIILTLLVYALIGASLVTHSMGKMTVAATLSEWMVMILLWPCYLQFFAHLEKLQSSIKAIEIWSSNEDRESYK